MVAVSFAAACSSGDRVNLDESQHMRSPGGSAVAYIAEYYTEEKAHTEVIVMFGNGSCGGLSAHAMGIDIDVDLVWIDDESLEVRHPQSRPFVYPPSGDIIECDGRQVRIVLVPKRDSSSRTR